jgi:hypothetical protein
MVKHHGSERIDTNINHRKINKILENLSILQSISRPPGSLVEDILRNHQQPVVPSNHKTVQFPVLKQFKLEQGSNAYRSNFNNSYASRRLINLISYASNQPISYASLSFMCTLTWYTN